MDGYIKLHRKFLDWEWYKDAATKIVYLHLLLKASWYSTSYRGHNAPAGTVVTTIRELAEETNLTDQRVKTALQHLKKTNEITIKTTNKFTLIHIEKWAIYQCDEERINDAVKRVFQNM